MNANCLPKAQAVRETNLARLRAVADSTGVDLGSPIDSNTAFQLLRELGYAACRVRLDYHLRSGKLKPPQKVLGHYAWDEVSLLDFAASLEATPGWRPPSALL